MAMSTKAREYYPGKVIPMTEKEMDALPWPNLKSEIPTGDYPKRTVYLAGPITGLAYDKARSSWRRKFAFLMPSHIFCLSPMRVVTSLMPEQGLKGMPQAEGVDAMLVNRAILARDEADLRTADAIVACLLGAEKPSQGTVAELGMAHVLRKPVILIMEDEGNCHEHPFVTSIGTFRTTTLREAADIVTHLLTPGV